MTGKYGKATLKAILQPIIVLTFASSSEMSSRFCERAILRKAGAKISVMETRLLKVVRQGEAFSVQSSKQESGQIQKCNIVLKELGGSKFENEFVCTMLGNLAGCRFYEGDVVIATLRFSTHEYQGQTFQEILATDIVKLNK